MTVKHVENSHSGMYLYIYSEWGLGLFRNSGGRPDLSI
jgi:hypothetical protein